MKKYDKLECDVIYFSKQEDLLTESTSEENDLNYTDDTFDRL